MQESDMKRYAFLLEQKGGNAQSLENKIVLSSCLLYTPETTNQSSGTFWW